MMYDVFVTRRAMREAEEILDWIAERSPQGAIHWAHCLDKLLARLRNSADMCAVAPEGQRYGIDIRQTFFRTKSGTPYRALFEIQSDRLYVIHLRGPGQDLMHLDQIELPN